MKALGVDVGLHHLDLVLLEAQRAIEAVHGHLLPEVFSKTVRDLEPDIVAIDSPARWATASGRATEQAMRRLNIQLYATPALHRRSATGFHDWMGTGMAAFDSIAEDYPLFGGEHYLRSAIEVFPHATAVALAGHLRPHNKTKIAWRREVLQAQGVEIGRLTDGDLVDAALAALTGLLALAGCASWFGQPDEGVIVLPCRIDAVPLRYAAPDVELETQPYARCLTCGHRNPSGSRFCNQCGARIRT